MYDTLEFHPRCTVSLLAWRRQLICTMVFGWLILAIGTSDLGIGQVQGQQVQGQQVQGQQVQVQNANELPYTEATQLVPDFAAGLIRVPDFPDFCDALEQTHAGQLRKEELVKPFFDAQRERVRDYLESVDNKIGIRLEDLSEIASGEVVFAWLPFPNDKRRPYSLCLVADIRGRKAKADQALQTIDTDLQAGGWMRTDTQHQGQEVRVYGMKPKPGQLKVEQIAICINDSRIVTSDRDTVVTDFLDAEAGKPAGKSISEEAEFKQVTSRADEMIKAPIESQGGTLAVQWFARPFGMGRIGREAFNVDRGNDIDIIKLLENQGFAAITAAGGTAAINGTKYDLLHKGVIRANRPFVKAARMLQFDAQPRQPIPRWVSSETASFNRLRIKIEDAFWSAGTLVDEALGDEIFDEMIQGIYEDKEGPQIDIKNNVMPSLDNEVILLSDNVLPADVSSERMLIAIRLSDVDKMKTAMRKWGESEPDASKMESTGLEDIDIWQVVQGAGGEDDTFDAELFDDFEDFEEEEEETKPLLDKWAIGIVPQGPGSDADYLMFSSHSELLIETAKRIQAGAGGGLAEIDEIKQVEQALDDLGVGKPIFDRIVRTKLSLRVKYELLRQGKLRDSDSVLAKLVLRMSEEDADEPDPLNANTLPPIAQIEKYLADGGSYVEETEEGWEMTGFLLK